MILEDHPRWALTAILGGLVALSVNEPISSTMWLVGMVVGWMLTRHPTNNPS